jgi:hypothetical protein
MKSLFREFQDRLAEVVSEQRLKNGEARNEATKARLALEDLVRAAKQSVEDQRQAVSRLRDEWRLHVVENSRAAGEEIARAFGAQMAVGLRQQLERLAAGVEQATQRFGWMSALKWAAGIALGITLTISVGVWAMLPRVEGASWTYVWIAAAHLRGCEVHQEAHVCIATDEKQQLLKSANGEPLVVVRGM